MVPAWWFEVLIVTEKTLEKNYLTVQNICKRLESRSFHMKDLKDLMMPKSSNIGPMADQERLERSISQGQMK